MKRGGLISRWTSVLKFFKHIRRNNALDFVTNAMIIKLKIHSIGALFGLANHWKFLYISNPSFGWSRFSTIKHRRQTMEGYKIIGHHQIRGRGMEITKSLYKHLPKQRGINNSVLHLSDALLFLQLLGNPTKILAITRAFVWNRAGLKIWSFERTNRSSGSGALAGATDWRIGIDGLSNSK